METPSSDSSPSYAPQVCTACKTRKRKCDKALPTCASCSKRNLTCDYQPRSEQSRDSTSAADRIWYNPPVDGDEAGFQPIDYPTILFLDPNMLQQVDLSPAATSVPAHILPLLGDMDEISATASKFFEKIHLWMPFVSMKRFYDLYLRPSFQSRADIVLLFLAIKLITTLPPESPRNPRTSLYHATKHFYLEVEGSSVLSLPVLQAGVLVALYELGHGIYPTAFLSIGACARYAHALGINVSETLKIRRALTLVEAEERRRVWWAIVILDRFVSIGCPGRPFAATDPTLDDLLPTEDEAWDHGTLRTEVSSTLSSPLSSHMSRFALLCQAARLLGQVLHYVSSNSAMHDDDVWMQLDRTLQSMLAASLEVDSPDHDRITFIYSALVALHAPWMHADHAAMFQLKHRSQRAKLVIQQVTEKIRTRLLQHQCFLGRSPDDMSPWGLFFAYHICAAHMRTSRENPESDELVRSLRETFQTIDIRWNVAGAYLQLLEAREVASQFPTNSSVTPTSRDVSSKDDLERSFYRETTH